MTISNSIDIMHQQVSSHYESLIQRHIK